MSSRLMDNVEVNESEELKIVLLSHEPALKEQCRVRQRFWRRFKEILRLSNSLLAFFEGSQLVRLVGPGLPPEERYKFESAEAQDFRSRSSWLL